MPKVSQMFPSKYLQAADVEGQAYTLTVKVLVPEEINSNDGTAEQKWIVYFNEAKKGLVLNKTNAGTLEWLYGSDSDMWTGKQVVLFTEMTSFMGKPCLGIRMRGPDAMAPMPSATLPAALGEPQAPLTNGPTGPGEQAAEQARKAKEPIDDNDDISDSIPF